MVALAVDGLAVQRNFFLRLDRFGNVGDGTLSPDMRANAIGIVALVGDDDGALRRGRRAAAAAQVTSWTSPGEIRRQTGRPFAIDPRVDFRGEASSASAHTTISTLFLTPEAC